MRALIYSIGLMLLFSVSLKAEKIEKVKKSQQVYENVKNGSFYFSNKYGNLILANWDKDEISITSEIIVRAKTEELAEKYLSEIESLIGKNGDSVYAVTQFAKSFEVDKKFELEIKYVVKAPASMSYNLNNKYGDIAIAKITGPCEINLKYGNLLAKNLLFNKSQRLCEIEMAYSNAQIEYCNYADIELKYGKLKFGNGKSIELEAKYADVNVNFIEFLKFEGKYGGLDVDSIYYADIEAQYMNVDIDYLRTKLIAESKYGNFDVKYIEPDFELIEIESSFGNVDLNIHPDAVYTIDADIDFGNVKLPSKVNVDRIKNNSDEEVKGIVGSSNKSPTGVVKVEINFGNLKL
ncbi:MAG: DUF4097 family beta strand repeat protein [Bacteroidales bacterium]|nr:DUF4097 family beta strand repeat protein [Bacteroidales bacterium]